MKGINGSFLSQVFMEVFDKQSLDKILFFSRFFNVFHVSPRGRWSITHAARPRVSFRKTTSTKTPMQRERERERTFVDSRVPSEHHRSFGPPRSARGPRYWAKHS